MKVNSFELPLKNYNEVFSKEDLQSQIVVVSIIGKSSLDSPDFVPKIILDLFKNQKIENEDIETESNKLNRIEGRYLPEEKILFLHCAGPFNPGELSRHFQKFKDDLKTKGFLSCWNQCKSDYGKKLLFIFSMSHVVIYTAPTTTFDLSFVQLLKIVGYIRPRYQAKLTSLLGKFLLTEDWIYHGRLCTPRLLFLFTSCPQDIIMEEDDDEKLRRIKRLEHALEDQIYMTLRKSRLVKNVCNRAFFSIAPNDEFVFIQHFEELPVDEDVFERLIHKLEYDFFDFVMSSGSVYSDLSYLSDDAGDDGCFGDLASGSFDPDMSVVIDQGSSYSENMEHSLTEHNLHLLDLEFDDGDSGVFSTDNCRQSMETSNGLENLWTPTKTSLKDHTFKAFLMKHVHKAHSEGFYDNMGKYTNMKPFFEVPTLESWLTAANLIVNDLEESSIDSHHGPQDVMNKLLGTELQFSFSRCNKVMPLSLAVYQEGLPTHYSKALHEKQTRRAVSVLVHNARGPAQRQYVAQLKEECEKIWKSGRQTCEVLSLFKNSCTKPIHPIKTNPRRSAYDLECEHWNIVQYISTCNCGMRQTSRADPFTLKQANYEFYRMVGEECGCNRAERITFPVFQPSTQDYRAAEVNNYEYNVPEGTHQTPQEVTNIYHDVPGTRSTETLSIMNIGKLWTADDSAALTNASPLSHLSDPENHIVLNYFSTHHHDKHLVRQASTTEYLPGMVHIDSPVGLLPEYSSWSLICRGPSSLYSHNLGLHDQPGFLPGTNYLLPWDVTLGERDYLIPVQPEIIKRVQSAGYIPKSCKKYQRCSRDLITVKIFIGVEYECLRGHRFMSSSPGKVLKASGNGIVKENASKITKGNMPLYIPCPCGKVVAQLMRIHIVTPKAPVYVTIDPKVRPAPDPCPVFVTGSQKPAALSQSAYWVLRLPYVYATERNCYSLPTHLKKLKYGELLGPTYGITQIE